MKKEHAFYSRRTKRLKDKKRLASLHKTTIKIVSEKKEVK